jgi:hypothetical protein
MSAHVGIAEHVTVADSTAELIAELIADCAQLPDSVLRPATPVPVPALPEAPPWRVSAACHDQVAGMDDYGV